MMAQPVVVARDRWVPYEGNYYLYRGDVQVAGWNPRSNEFRWYNAGTDTWSQPQGPPWEQAAGR